MASLVPAVIERLHLTHDVVATMRQIGEGKGKQDLFKERAPDVLENLRQVAIIESTESSNRLEGVTLPRTVLERIVRKNEDPRPENRSEGEVAGYRNVLQLIHERFEYMDVTPNIILPLHRDPISVCWWGNGGRMEENRQRYNRAASGWIDICQIYSYSFLANAQRNGRVTPAVYRDWRD